MAPSFYLVVDIIRTVNTGGIGLLLWTLLINIPTRATSSEINTFAPCPRDRKLRKRTTAPFLPCLVARDSLAAQVPI